MKYIIAFSLISFFSMSIFGVIEQSKFKHGVVNILKNENDFLAIPDGKVVVDFYAEWCPPCQKMHSILEQLAQEFNDIYFIKVDTDIHKSLSQKYKVMSLPTFKFFKNGQLVGEHSGAVKKSDFANLLKTKFQ